ncbi:hypothetical protein C8J31_11453 [Rhizobium sp. PP-CC-2G-626]|nr:hypothetical protein C8J31_11453 [Rhizobium sp. PP-CC-2G-626]
MDKTHKVENGISKFLEQYEKSPYSYPSNDRKSVEGISTLKGSWQAAAN